MTDWVEVGAARRPMPGEVECGDDFVVVHGDDTVLIAVIDGLGHGETAAEAAAVAVTCVREAADQPLPELLLTCHERMRRTRGAVMTIARLARGVDGAELTWAGVGNVEGVYVRMDGTRERVLALGGIVGYSIARILPRTLPMKPGELVALATDGLRSDFTRGLSPHTTASCGAIAEAVLLDHARPSDDACIVVARVVGLA